MVQVSNSPGGSTTPEHNARKAYPVRWTNTPIVPKYNNAVPGQHSSKDPDSFLRLLTFTHGMPPLRVPDGISLRQFLDIQELSKGD